MHTVPHFLSQTDWSASLQFSVPQSFLSCIPGQRFSGSEPLLTSLDVTPAKGNCFRDVTKRVTTDFLLETQCNIIALVELGAITACRLNRWLISGDHILIPSNPGSMKETYFGNERKPVETTLSSFTWLSHVPLRQITQWVVQITKCYSRTKPNPTIAARQRSGSHGRGVALIHPMGHPWEARPYPYRPMVTMDCPLFANGLHVGYPLNKGLLMGRQFRVRSVCVTVNLLFEQQCSSRYMCPFVARRADVLYRFFDRKGFRLFVSFFIGEPARAPLVNSFWLKLKEPSAKEMWNFA